MIRTNGTTKLHDLSSKPVDSRFAPLAHRLLARRNQEQGLGISVGISGFSRNEDLDSVTRGLAESALMQCHGTVVIVDAAEGGLPEPDHVDRGQPEEHSDGAIYPSLVSRWLQPSSMSRLFVLYRSRLQQLPHELQVEQPCTFVVNELRQHADLTIFRLPAVDTLYTAWSWLCELEGLLLVFQSGAVKVREAESAVLALRKAGIPILGSVLVDVH